MSAIACHGLLFVSVIAFLIPGLRASAQIPRRFQFVRITDDDAYQSRQRINRHGDVVFPSSPGWADDPRAELFLYRNGKVIQITDDDANDREPDINDDGVIVWQSAIGPVGEYGPTYEIMMRLPDGEVIRLTDDDHDDYSPRINNSGYVVWNSHLGYGCPLGTIKIDLFEFDGSEVRRLTFDADDDNGLANQGQDINDLGQIAWTRYDFCTGGEWTSRIMLLDGNKMFPVSLDGTRQPQAAKLNNKGQIVWQSVNGDRDQVELWDHGRVEQLWLGGGLPAINDRGWVAFSVSDPKTRVTELALLRKGRFSQLTFSEDEQDWVADINRFGEITWNCGRSRFADVCLLRRHDLRRADLERLVPIP